MGSPSAPSSPVFARARDLARWRPGRPILVADLHAFDRNVDATVARAGGLPVRLATKSIRCRALIDRALRAPGVRGLLCYAAAEAAALADAGYRDLLVAYPTMDPEAVRRLARLPAGQARLVVDDPDQVAWLAGTIPRDGASRVGLVLDVDLSLDLPGLWFGVRRSPVRTADGARAIVDAVRASGHPGLRVEGLMGYEAQVAGVPDRPPGRAILGPVVRRLKAASGRLAQRRRSAVRQALEEATGRPCAVVNGGGSGSLEQTRQDRAVTELAAGSALVGPTFLDRYDAFRPEPSVFFALPVVRRPAPGIVTCFAGGYVASGEPGPDKLPVPVHPPGLRLRPEEGAGEVQTPLHVPEGVRLELGDLVFFRHAKSGEPMERFLEMALVGEGAGVKGVATYRGEGWGFG